MKGGFRVILYLFWMALLLSALQLARFLIQGPSQRDILTNRQLQQDLHVLQQQIHRFSAFAVLHPAVQAQIEQQILALKQRYPTQLSRQQFTLEVANIITLLQDPAASVSPWPTTAILPVTLQKMGNKWIALNRHQQPFDTQHPFVSHIDGLPIRKWCTAASKLISDGVARPQQLANMLMQTELLRQQIGLPAKESVRLTLQNDAGDTISANMPLQENLPQPKRAISRWRLLAPNIQLLRNDDLDSFESNRQLRLDLQKALSAETLVLDLRHADGASDQLLKLLASEHENPATQPVGFGRYKRDHRLRNDFLAPFGYLPLSHFSLFPSIHAKLTQAQTSELSEWFAKPPLVSEIHHSQVTYPKQLLLLIGPQCRHECEWLVHAAADWQNTLLLGRKTLGDYGRAHQFRLPASELNVQVSASLAYDRFGNLMSGVGTTPDIVINDDEHVDWSLLLRALQQYQQSEDEHQHPKTRNPGKA